MDVFGLGTAVDTGSKVTYFRHKEDAERYILDSDVVEEVFDVDLDRVESEGGEIIEEYGRDDDDD
jgi:hypothetical protein